MEVFRPPRVALCVYECLRLFFLIGAYLLLQPQGATNFPWLTLITPGALFLLMALFHLHGPLYLAGKSISVITTVLWLFFTKKYIIGELLYSTAAIIIAPGIFFFLLLGDMLSAWLVTGIMKSSGGG